MKKVYLFNVLPALVMAAFVFILMPVPAFSYEGTYIGIKNYGKIGRSVALDPKKAIYYFNVDGKKKKFSIDCGVIYPDRISDAEKADDKDYFCVMPAEDGAYPIQNILHEGESYRITLKGRKIVSCEPVCVEHTVSSVVSGIPGKRTVKNFLQTALMPVGNVLYVYGGGWDWQDIGASDIARTIGFSETWKKFFDSQDENYLYEDDDDPLNSTYPYGEWNQYYYLGLDCSGYVGWTLYNTMFDKSLAYPGFVTSSGKMAERLAEKYKLGIWNHHVTELRPGDIVSLSSHVYICVGVCEDGSMVFLESTPSPSRTGKRGGGVQLSAFSMKGADDHDCDAYSLASYYMKKYYPEWYSRYPVFLSCPDSYFSFPDDKPSSGVFRWNLTDDALDGSGTVFIGLADPDGITGMSAAEVLAVLFGEK